MFFREREEVGGEREGGPDGEREGGGRNIDRLPSVYVPRLDIEPTT